MTQSVVIYHNPRCSKSRETLDLLKKRGVQPEIILYLDNPPDATALEKLLKQLEFSSARQLMRNKEDLYKQLNLDDPALTERQLIQAMVDNPKLIERPIVVSGDRARLGRPPEQVLDIL